MAQQNEFVALQNLLTYLVFQIVARHHLNACDISTSACDKVRLTRAWRQNHALHHILKIGPVIMFQYILF